MKFDCSFASHLIQISGWVAHVASWVKYRITFGPAVSKLFGQKKYSSGNIELNESNFFVKAVSNIFPTFARNASHCWLSFKYQTPQSFIIWLPLQLPVITNAHHAGTTEVLDFDKSPCMLHRSKTIDPFLWDLVAQPLSVFRSELKSETVHFTATNLVDRLAPFYDRKNSQFELSLVKQSHSSMFKGLAISVKISTARVNLTTATHGTNFTNRQENFTHYTRCLDTVIDWTGLINDLKGSFPLLWRFFVNPLPKFGVHSKTKPLELITGKSDRPVSNFRDCTSYVSLMFFCAISIASWSHSRTDWSHFGTLVFSSNPSKLTAYSTGCIGRRAYTSSNKE